MRKSKFSESQIVGMLKGAESGMPVADLLRKHGVSKATFFKWRSSSRPDQIPKQSTRFLTQYHTCSGAVVVPS
jgi:transposase-like protein